MTYLNPELKERIYGSGSQWLLNRHFNKWKNHVEWNLKTREGNYDSTLGKRFLADVKSHIEEYRRPKSSSSTLFLTHPFMLHLSHFDMLTKFTMPDAYNHLENVLNVLDRNSHTMNIVVFEIAYDYAAITSKLLEDGLIDDVILTEYGEGIPLDKEKDHFSQYANNNVFIGGAYNNKCLKSSINSMKKTIPIENMRFANDLIINSPQYFDDRLTLHRIAISSGVDVQITDRRVVSIDEMFGIAASKKYCSIEKNQA